MRVQDCSDPAAPVIVEPSNHHYFDESIFQSMTTAYIDGCSYNHHGVLKAGAEITWLDDNSHMSQYVETAAVLITLELAAQHGLLVANLYRLQLCTPRFYMSSPTLKTEWI